MTGSDTQVPPPAPSDDPPVDDVEAWIADEDADLEAAPRSAFTMRHPVLLVLILVGAGFMLLKSWPAVSLMIAGRSPVSCGDLTERPVIRQTAPDTLIALRHNTWCTVNAVVDRRTIYATGEATESKDPREQQAGRKYFLKLAGDNVFAVLAADREDVVRYRLRKGSLLGFEVKGPGRIIEPSTSGGFQQTEQFLRNKFPRLGDRPLWLYDTTDDPMSRWPYALISLLMVFTLLLAGVGLVRVTRERLANRSS